MVMPFLWLSLWRVCPRGPSLRQLSLTRRLDLLRCGACCCARPCLALALSTGAAHLLWRGPSRVGGCVAGARLWCTGMDEGLLAPTNGPNGTPRAPRASIMLAMESSAKKHVHHHVLSAREEAIMNKFEALDYDVIENK
jgi:hypothetical protein